MPMSVAQNIELFRPTHVLSGYTLLFIPDKQPKYPRPTVQLNTGHLATLSAAESFVIEGILYRSRAAEDHIGSVYKFVDYGPSSKCYQTL